MPKIGVGLVGAGSFGELHLQVCKVLNDVEVVAVCDSNQSRLEEIGAKYGVKVLCTDYRQLCERDDIEIVFVATPESDHAGPVEQAARCGKHVFLEKPIATTLDDARRIVDSVTQAGVYLMVGHILRFESRYATVKRLCNEGTFGRIVSIHARRNRAKRLYQTYGDRVHGLLVNAIHDIDLCLWYTGDSVARVRGVTRNIQGKTYPDVNWGFLEFKGGGVACLETHWLLPDRAGVVTEDSMQVIGTNGVANLALVPSGLTLWNESGSETMNVSYDAWFHGEIRGPLRDEIAYFVQCVRESRQPEVIRPWEAVEALRVALALVKSSEEDREIEL